MFVSPGRAEGGRVLRLRQPRTCLFQGPKKGAGRVKEKFGLDSRAVERMPGEHRQGRSWDLLKRMTQPRCPPVAEGPRAPSPFQFCLSCIWGYFSHVPLPSFLKKPPVCLDSFSLFLKTASCLNSNHDAEHKSLIQHVTFLKRPSGGPLLCVNVGVCLG